LQNLLFDRVKSGAFAVLFPNTSYVN